MFQHLFENLFGDVHERDFFLDANLADDVAGDVGVEGDLPHNVVRADVVNFAFVDFATHHPLLMSATSFDAGLVAKTSAGGGFFAPEGFALSSARKIAVAAFFGHLRHFGNGTLFFIAARNFDRGGGDVHDIVAGFDQFLNHLQFAFEASAPEPDFEFFHDLRFAVFGDLFGRGQFHFF